MIYMTREITGCMNLFLGPVDEEQFFEVGYITKNVMQKKLLKGSKVLAHGHGIQEMQFYSRPD